MTLEETIELCRRMSTAWDSGVAILNELEPRYSNEPERILDIGVAKALGIQFRSGYNILRFYQLREKMFRMEGMERLHILDQLHSIISEEMELNEKLLELCRRDSRLGFHSEAEGYKYFPEKIQWRMQQLQDLVDNDIPKLEQMIRKNKLLFPEFTGKEPSGPTAYAIPSDDSIWTSSGFDFTEDLSWQSCEYGPDDPGVRWAAKYDEEALYIIVSDTEASVQPSSVSPISRIDIKIEPRRLWPCKHFTFDPKREEELLERIDYVSLQSVDGRIIRESGSWYSIVRLPFERIWWSKEVLHPVRIDVRVKMMETGTISWRPDNPTTYRLNLGTDNPADLGWLLFEKPQPGARN
jgi:hypothetical protein